MRNIFDESVSDYFSDINILQQELFDNGWNIFWTKNGRVSIQKDGVIIQSNCGFDTSKGCNKIIDILERSLKFFDDYEIVQRI